MTQNPQDGSDGLFGDDDDEARFEASRAPLLSHLTELRSRLIQSGIALLAGFVFCFFSPSRSIFSWCNPLRLHKI